MPMPQALLPPDEPLWAEPRRWPPALLTHTHASAHSRSSGRTSETERSTHGENGRRRAPVRPSAHRLCWPRRRRAAGHHGNAGRPADSRRDGIDLATGLKSGVGKSRRGERAADDRLGDVHPTPCRGAEGETEGEEGDAGRGGSGCAAQKPSDLTPSLSHLYLEITSRVGWMRAED